MTSFRDKTVHSAELNRRILEQVELRTLSAMCIDLVSKTLNSLPRISFILIFHFILFLCLIRVSKTTDDDERWTEIHGNVPLTSGMWDYLWTISDDEEKLKNISFQAHKRCFNVIPNVTWANASIKELFFPDNFNFEPIKIDVLMYTVAGRHHYRAPDKPWHFYLTKGLRHDCVYFLMPFDMNKTKELHLLPDHICDLKMPTAVAPPISS